VYRPRHPLAAAVVVALSLAAGASPAAAQAAIDIEKATNGQDADAPPGPVIAVGSPVAWTYVVTNTGTETLDPARVGDDQGVLVSCPQSVLAPGESMTCTASGVALPGQYANLGTALGTGPAGDVTDTDPSHYFGQGAAIDLEKFTNGEDADTPPGPNIPAGDPVAWTYVVTNTGSEALTSVAVTDDQGVAVSCPQTTLAPGESMTCTAADTAVAGQYANLGTVTADAPMGTVSDSDPSHYHNEQVPAVLDLEKLTEGQDADAPPGPTLNAGDPVTWTYLVTNGTADALTAVTVTDDQGVAITCPQTTLAPGEAMTCTAAGTVTVGQYANVGTVTGTPPAGPPLADSDPSHYLGVSTMPAVDLEKATNGQDADVPPGPGLLVGDPVAWTYVVTNTGGVLLVSVAVTDDQGVAVGCPATSLQPGESMTCTAAGTVAPGQYANVGTVEAESENGIPVTDSDPSHYQGFFPGAIDVEKATNGQDADTPPGPAILVGDPITWTYLVTNPGQETLTAVGVSDNQGVAVSCPQTTLAPGESMTCTAAGTAAPGPYANVGIAMGTPPVGGPATDSDPSHYRGAEPGLVDLEAAVDGLDADAPPGLEVPAGQGLVWTFVVTNIGSEDLSGVVVSDDQGLAVTCPQTTLAAGESMTCTAVSAALPGQQEHVAIVEGTAPAGPLAADTDPTYYRGLLALEIPTASRLGLGLLLLALAGLGIWLLRGSGR
jgi:hypothetical protein